MPVTNSEHHVCGRRRRLRPQKPTVRRNPLVLSVDDDEDLTRIIKARLQTHEIDVTRASSGREGLKQARSHRPSVIVTDLGMAGGDGEYLLRRLNSRASTAGIPVIVLSGLDDDARISAAFGQGASAILRKPFNFDELVQEIVPHLMPERSEDDDEFDDFQEDTFLGEERFHLGEGHDRSFYVDQNHVSFRPYMPRNR